MQSFTTRRALRLLCPSLDLVADTLKCITLHRGRCTGGPLGVLNCFNFANEVLPAVALGGTQHKVFSHTALAHFGKDETDFQRIDDRFVALGFVDHDVSLECCDGIEEVAFERRAQNLCQLPDHTRFARWLVRVEQPSPSLESFTFCVGQDHLQRFPFAEENQRVIEVGRNTSQFTRVPVHEFLSHLSHRSFLSRSGSHCSDDFLYSSTLKPSCPGTEHPGPVSPRSVIAAEVLWLISRRKRSKSESRVVSSWCFWHLGPCESTPTTCCHCSLCSVQSFLRDLASIPFVLPGTASLARQLLRSSAVARSTPSLVGSVLQLVAPCVLHM